MKGWILWLRLKRRRLSKIAQKTGRAAILFVMSLHEVSTSKEIEDSAEKRLAPPPAPAIDEHAASSECSTDIIVDCRAAGRKPSVHEYALAAWVEFKKMYERSGNLFSERVFLPTGERIGEAAWKRVSGTVSYPTHRC